MGSHWRVFRIGLAAFLAGGVLGSALPAAALQTAIDVTITTDPEAPYFGDPIDYTILVEATGGAVADLTVRMEHDCNECAASGPTELSGNGDRVLEPGERWQYMARSDHVFQGLVGAVVMGTDEAGNPVGSSVLVDYGAPWPLEVGFSASASEVSEGDQVTWEMLLGNPGSLPIEISGEVQILQEGRHVVGHSRLGDPVVLRGNDDNRLDPGEVWAFSYTAALWRDSWLEVAISGSLVVEAFGPGFRADLESDIVTVVLPATGFEMPIVALIGLLLLTVGVVAISSSSHLPGRNRFDGRSRV